MCEEVIKNLLKTHGLTKIEAEAYIHLSKYEPLTGTKLAKLLKKDKGQVFYLLKKLQAKGFVEKTLEYPIRYTTVPFESILNSIIKSKQKEVTYIQDSKKDLFRTFKKKTANGIEEDLEKFLVVKGNMKICSKITQIFQNTKHQISIIAPIRILLQIDKDEIVNNSINDNQDIQINYRFLTQISEQNLNVAKILLSKINRNRSKFEVRVPDLTPGLCPKMIIRDNEETLLFISKKTNNKDETCLWTNCKTITQTFMSMFESLWQNSKTIQESIKYLESSKSMPPLSPLTFKGEYEKAVTSAKKEIIILTSSNGLNQKLNLNLFFEMIAKKGIPIKILATLTSLNLDACRELSKFCEIKHVPKGYPEALLIDGERFFQFEEGAINKEEPLITYGSTHIA